jgi:two-component system, LytTR family, sensor kinase
MKRKMPRWAIHLLGWLAFFSLPFLLQPDLSDCGTTMASAAVPLGAKAKMLSQPLWIVPFFYANVFWVFPFSLSRHRYRVLILAQVGMFSLFVGIMHLAHLLIGATDTPAPPMFLVAMIYIVTTLIGLSYYLIDQQMKEQALQSERERVLLQTELQFLRWQISPHFLFNVLNGMAATARLRPKEVEPIILQLSNLLRYMLYDGGDHKIGLDKEIEYLDSYIYLQRMRLGKAAQMSIKWEVEQPEQYTIEPMLLIPFVENVFKHGHSSAIDTGIEIAMHIQHKQLRFQTRNRLAAAPTDVATYGIGLANVRKRLEMLYGANAAVITKKGDDYFFAQLTINLAAC